MKEEKKKKKRDWCVMHWLGGEVKMIGSEEDCKEWAKRNSFNPEAPIYFALPVAGVQIIVHQHEHTHKEIVKRAKRA